MQGFTKSVKARLTEQVPVVEFFIETYQPKLNEEDGKPEYDDEGNPVEEVYRRDDFQAKMPTQEVLLLAFSDAANQDSTMADESAAMLDILRAALTDDEVRTIRNRIKDPNDAVDWEMIGELVLWLMEQWQDFPTKSPSGSSGSQTASGTRSTGRVHGPGSIL